jgi:malonate-semialdehyde dehydrogenase (acetylating)/methylmalonate-semialdehyde dehydrogenase
MISRVQAVSFVGSTPIAEYIYKTATSTGKRCQALGGAKNHAIVMPDADLENVVSSLLGAAFGSSGERCMALSVAVAVGDEIADTLVQQLSERMQGLKYGHFANKDNDFGPVITAEHKAKVIGHIDSAEQQGATVVVDGRHAAPDGYENGFFVGPTLIDQVTPNMLSYQQEIFGPVLQIIRVETMQEAMDLIDNHEYGNGTCIYTRDGEAARYFSDHIKVGMVVSMFLCLYLSLIIVLVVGNVHSLVICMRMVQMVYVFIHVENHYSTLAFCQHP